MKTRQDYKKSNFTFWMHNSHWLVSFLTNMLAQRNTLVQSIVVCNLYETFVYTHAYEGIARLLGINARTGTLIGESGGYATLAPNRLITCQKYDNEVTEL